MGYIEIQRLDRRTWLYDLARDVVAGVLAGVVGLMIVIELVAS